MRVFQCNTEFSNLVLMPRSILPEKSFSPRVNRLLELLQAPLCSLQPQAHSLLDLAVLALKGPTVWICVGDRLFSRSQSFSVTPPSEQFNKCVQRIHTQCTQRSAYASLALPFSEDCESHWFCGQPLIVESEVVAVIGLADDSPREIEPLEHRFLTTASSLLAACFKEELHRRGQGSDEILHLTQSQSLRARLRRETPPPAEPDAVDAKIKTLSLFASGIAHDLNNCLAAIRLNIAGLQVDLENNPEGLTALFSSEQMLGSAQILVKQLLNFSRPMEPVRCKVDLIRLLNEKVAPFFERRCPLVFDFEPGPFWTEVDPEQMVQVFQNLILNAFEASPPETPVHISAQRLQTDDGKPYLSFKIIDQGTGMTPDIQAKIFEPYFTSKAQGLGLGLASSLQIVQKHNGALSCSSLAGHGTTFTLSLHPCEPAYDMQQPLTRTSIPKSATRRRILIMDDHTELVAALARLLKIMGYETLPTRSGQECVETFRTELTHGNAIDAVILDLTVETGFGALETLPILRNIDPAVKVILSTGFTGSESVSNYQCYGFNGLLPKPYDADLLGGLLNKVIPEGKSGQNA